MKKKIIVLFFLSCFSGLIAQAQNLPCNGLKVIEIEGAFQMERKNYISIDSIHSLKSSSLIFHSDTSCRYAVLSFILAVVPSQKSKSSLFTEKISGAYLSRTALESLRNTNVGDLIIVTEIKVKLENGVIKTFAGGNYYISK